MKRVGNLHLGCWNVLFIIAVFYGSMGMVSFAARPTAKPSSPPVTPASTQKPAAQSASQPVSSPASKAVSVAPAQPAATQPASPALPPLRLRLIPQKDIFSNHEGVVMQFVFTARTKTKLCLDKDILSQMQVSLFQAGVGKLPLVPLVIKDNSHLFQEPLRVVWLNAGQSLTVRANLKRFQLDGGNTWIPGEYGASATFNLCEQTPTEVVTDPGRETPIPASGQGWFMISE